jgi:hypothetical protein
LDLFRCNQQHHRIHKQIFLALWVLAAGRAEAAVLPVVVVILALPEVAAQALRAKETVALVLQILTLVAAVEAVVQVLSLLVAQARLTQ